MAIFVIIKLPNLQTACKKAPQPYGDYGANRTELKKNKIF